MTDSFCLYVLKVAVIHSKTEIELACDYLGGIDVSDDMTEARVYFEDCIEDMISSVCSDAEENVIAIAGGC